MIGHRRAWLVVGLLVAASLSGCAAKDDSAPSTSAPSMGAMAGSDMGSMTHAGGAADSGIGVDAGFAYDMSVHHAQAVQMAEMVAGRLTDPEVALLARDIALTQQYQIGEMRGWLDAWSLPPTTTQEPMAWMGMSGPMPGLASPDELERLRTAPAGQVDRLFLELMIRHHRGGLTMAEHARDHAEAAFVRQFAASVAAAQTGEVETMNAILQRLPAA